MERKTSRILWFLLLTVCFCLARGTASQSEDSIKTYIVYLGDLPEGDIESPTSIHKDLLQQVTCRNSVPKSLIHSFKRSFSGFVVNLTEEEMHKMAAMEGVVSVFPNEVKELHTTRSWDFIGFPQTVKRATTESDIIIGVIDSGIWPESESFDDTGYGPPPAKWKGVCQSSANFTCNNKIIGGKYYRSTARGNRPWKRSDIASPRDSNGHGTHAASTAAGNLVNKASLFGLGEGTARGGAPAARIAAYKVCWSDGCKDADILAAFDDAIADGVDIISLSVGTNTTRSYFSDSIAIGSFHAMRKGILTSMSAGNNGPRFATSANIAPWALSVAASTTDRRIVTMLRLGNGVIIQGRTVNTFDLGNKAYPIIHGRDAPNKSTSLSTTWSRYCLEGTLDPTLVKGKIVFCESGNNMTAQIAAGAIGTILFNGDSDYATVCPLPASNYNRSFFPSIVSYVNSTKPTATIFKSNEINEKLAPFVINFSSRGPNNNTRDILKPDLSAPGVEIVAAWSGLGPISGLEGDNRVSKYNIASGTSMACPHATGAATYVKSFHPTWSPAAIKSALMTTATSMSSALNPEAEFAYGSGNIDPTRALNPGLVYDASEVDYIKFLCGQGYSDRSLRLVTGDTTSTCSSVSKETASNLNYPSMALSVPSSTQTFSRVFNRVVTNVGPSTSTYTATVPGAPAGLNIVVKPNVLKFTSTGQNLSFSVDVRGTITGQSKIMSASLVWSDGVHKVRSPIVVYNLPM